MNLSGASMRGALRRAASHFHKLIEESAEGKREQFHA
jgi:hypothetical protein